MKTFTQISIFYISVMTSILWGQENNIDVMYETISLSNRSYLDSLNNINYLKPIQILLDNKNNFKNVKEADFSTYRQMMESAFSYVHHNEFVKNDYKIIAKHLKLYKAIPYLKKRIKNKQRVVMLNEAHHIPKHRLFGETLLKLLYDKGFKFLAVETLYWKDTNINNRKYAISSTGYYTREPYFSNFIRKAINMGYTIIPYEQKEKTRDINKREGNQSKNLINFIAKNPESKVFVYAGYSHIKEKSDNNGIQWMAERFKNETKIDPFTINQTELKDFSNKKYSTLIDIEKTDDTLTNKYKGMFDVVIINPKNNKNLFKKLKRKEFDISFSKKYINNDNLFIIQAFIKSEYNSSGNKAIPFDQKIVSNFNDNVKLYLDVKNEYVFVIKNVNGTILIKKEVLLKKRNISL